MFTKSYQRSWIKIKVACGKNALQCYQELSEAYDENALPYKMVARWVKAFSAGQTETAYLHRTGQPSIPKHHVDIGSNFLSIGYP